MVENPERLKEEIERLESYMENEELLPEFEHQMRNELRYLKTEYHKMKVGNSLKEGGKL